MDTPLRIMIVEDNTLESMGLSACVRELGHQVVATAATPAEAIAYAKGHPLDCIFMDVNLGDGDGIHTMAEIQKLQDVPFIFITGYSDEKTVARASQLYPYGYLVKPVDIHDIRSALMVAQRSFEEKQQLKQDAANSRRQLAERKLIEKAKGILMDKFDYSESEAMTFLQKKSRKTNRKLVDVAKDIIDMSGAIHF